MASPLYLSLVCLQTSTVTPRRACKFITFLLKPHVFLLKYSWCFFFFASKTKRKNTLGNGQFDEYQGVYNGCLLDH